MDGYCTGSAKRAGLEESSAALKGRKTTRKHAEVEGS